MPPRVGLYSLDAYRAFITTPLTDPVFSGDRFRMYEFKIKRCARPARCWTPHHRRHDRCPKAKPHDWTQCPFAHPGEKAKRRDPRRFTYSGSACPEFRKAGVCSRGDACPLAHGVFETWLHPTRYKTQVCIAAETQIRVLHRTQQMCMDGGACRRKVCFFAHSQNELRMTGQTPAFNDAPMAAGMSTRLIATSPTPTSDPLHLLSGQVPSLELFHLLNQGHFVPQQPMPPQHDVAALLAAAGVSANAYAPTIPQMQPPPPPARDYSPDTPPALYRQDSIVSTPAPTRVHDACMLQPKSLLRHLSLDARHSSFPVGSPELEPALSAMLQNLSMSALEPVCEASAVAPELGLARASVQSGGFVLPHGYQLTSRSTVDNGVLAHMREIAQTELSQLSEAELAVLSKAYGESVGDTYGADVLLQRTPRGTPSPPSGTSFAATTPSAPAGSVLSVATSLGAVHSPREPVSGHGEAGSPQASSGSATSPTSGAWAGDIKRNFSIERLLSELPRSMSDMDVKQIVAASQGGVAVAGGACP